MICVRQVTADFGPLDLCPIYTSNMSVEFTLQHLCKGVAQRCKGGSDWLLRGFKFFPFSHEHHVSKTGPVSLPDPHLSS